MSVPENRKWRGFLNKFPKTTNSKCRHDFHPDTPSCLSYFGDGVIRALGIGAVIDILLLVKKRAPIKSLTKSFSTTIFLTSFISLFRGLLCILSRIAPNISPKFRRTLTLTIAGLSFLFSRQKGTIPMWLLFKAVQLHCSTMSNQVPPIVSNNFAVLVYALSVSYLLHQVRLIWQFITKV